MSGKRKVAPSVYRIELQGSLDEDWSDWFAGMSVAVERADDGSPVTCLTGMVADQSALRGLLSKIWDMGLTLLSVVRVESDRQIRTEPERESTRSSLVES
jgi:hypothetical protein